MGQIPLSQLLEGWVYWVFQPVPGSDHPTDTSGGMTERLNSGSDIWYLSGTWGNAGATPNKITRTLKVPINTSLFIVAASSHATPKEVGNENAPDADLEKYADNVHKLWTKPSVKVNGTPEPTTTESTRVVTPYISNGSYYARIAKGGMRRMATKADVCLIDSSRLGNAGDKHTIHLEAQSRKGDTTAGEPDEPAYKVDVEYVINVFDPRSS